MLKEEQRLFLKILKESLQGKTYELAFPGNDSFLRLMRLARNHHLLPMVCETIYQSECFENNNLFSSYKKKAIQNAAVQKIRTEEFLYLYHGMQNKGINPMVVKGVVCQSLYPNPLLRISVDDDLFAPGADFPVCHHFLQEFGLDTDSPVTNINTFDEISYHQKDSPLYIELHRSLFSETSSAYGHLNRLFQNAAERSVWFQTENNKIKTLCPTDHLLYLILHAFKHFLHSGIGIRPLCDIALFAECYYQEIDWKYIKKSLISTKTYDYTRALFRIIDKYLVPDAGYKAKIVSWDIETVDEEPLLQDILESGIHGASSMSRLHSSTITLNAVITNKKKTGILHSIFLPLQSMKAKYPFLNKAPYLLPAAWILRICSYAKETRSTPSDDYLDSIKIGRDRLDLLEKYRIISKRR